MHIIKKFYYQVLEGPDHGFFTGVVIGVLIALVYLVMTLEM